VNHDVHLCIRIQPALEPFPRRLDGIIDIKPCVLNQESQESIRQPAMCDMPAEDQLLTGTSAGNIQEALLLGSLLMPIDMFTVAVDQRFAIQSPQTGCNSCFGEQVCRFRYTSQFSRGSWLSFPAG